jgi:N-acetylglutamate synthase-like GNAT family acetyltransferase
VMRVRQANEGDLDWLLVQLREFDSFAETKLSLFPKDEAIARGFLHQFVISQPFFVAEGFSGLTGFIAGTLGNHYLNPDIRVLNEVFWWVDPRYRGTSAGARLLECFIGFGRLKADWIVMALEHKSPVNPRALLKKGFRLQETSYLMEVG